MNRLTKGLLFSIVVASLLLATDQFVLAENHETPVLEFDTSEMIIIITLGLGAGFLRAYQGYRTTPEDFDKLKFFDGVVKNALISVPLAIAAAMMQTELNIFIYVLIFFASLGMNSQLTATRKKSIPSNATDEEIENILKAEG